MPHVNFQQNLEKVKEINYRGVLRVFRPYYIIFLVLLIGISFYHLLFSRRLVPGVYIAGLDLGGLSYDQAVERLNQYELITDEDLALTYDGKNYDLQSGDVGLRYNWEATVNRAFEVGRTGNLYVDSKEKIAGLLKKNLYIAAYYDFDEEEFNKFLATVKGDLNSPAENAKYFIKNEDSLGILRENVGQELGDQELYDLVIKSFDDFNFGTKSLTVKPSEPDVVEEQLLEKLARAEEIVFSELKILYEDEEWVLTPEQKLEFLSYDVKEGDLGFNKATFRTYLESVSSVVGKLPRGNVTEEKDGRVLAFELTQDGVGLDTDITTETFKDAYFGLKNEVNVVTKNISGPVDPQQYGIFALLGEGNSKFTGSAQGRMNNLILAASRTDGVLVPPGAIYSFNESVGEISAATGYDSAWIILGNRTVLGDGGGVCQTSTTLFRAILDSGLPVVTRNPHSYRVYYYEIESPVGIDASVYQPSLDLQFKNDTPNYVLVQTSWDLDEKTLTFRIYGTPDGREVEISEPVVTNEVSPPAPEYRDDPTLEKGVIRQIDFAAWGAKVSFTRKVTRDGEILYDDTFKTSYRPWKAIYLVGTKE